MLNAESLSFLSEKLSPFYFHLLNLKTSETVTETDNATATATATETETETERHPFKLRTYKL